MGSYWMSVAPNVVPPPVAAIANPDRPSPPQPNFNFPSILKDTEVDIRDQGKPLPPPAPRPEPPPKPTPEAAAPPATPAPDKPKGTPEKPKAEAAANGTYILQVGSFKSTHDAERMKAQLAMLGVSTRIQSVTRPDGSVWHRVVTGPIDGKKALDETQATLKKHGKDTLAIKVK